MILKEFCGVLGVLEARIGSNDRMVNSAELLRLGKLSRLASILPGGCREMEIVGSVLLDGEVDYSILIDGCMSGWKKGSLVQSINRVEFRMISHQSR